MQPEEKASDCDKPNTLCNRIFHFCKTDKEEENITTASGTYLREVISKNNTKALQMPPLAEFLHKYAVKQYDVLLLPENML